MNVALISNDFKTLKKGAGLDIRENLFDFSDQGHLYSDRDRSEKLILNPGTGEIVLRYAAMYEGGAACSQTAQLCQ
jgi:hypothetical protein